MARAEWSKMGKGKKQILVEPFSNESKNPSDNWLSTGLAQLLGDYLKTADKLVPITGIMRLFPPVQIQPDYKIVGGFQKNSTQLAVLINIYTSGNELTPLFQTGFSISPPNTGLVFIEMAKAAREILKKLNIGYDKKEFETEMYSTSSFEAYAAYIKGLEAMWKFDSNYIEVAKIWLNESRKMDLYFQKAYAALADLLGYQALEAKIAGKPYDHYLSEIDTIETLKINFSTRPSPVALAKSGPPKKIPASKDTNRYLSGNAHFIAGETAMKSGNLKEAKKEFEQTLAVVPEDTLALKNLFTILSQEGKPQEAAKVQNKISIQGLCY